MPQNKTRVLILGAQGRLGGSLQACWSESHIVTGLARPALDVSNLKALKNLLADLEFDVLVNATGLTNVDRCESAREEANLVNTLAPAVMAECASQQGARLIHFSTDYVFNGEKHEPYTEDDIPSPLGWYGATKLEGERLVQASDPLHMVVRVSWVFGPAKPSFVDSLIQRALHDVRVEAIDDKFSSPTSATDAAQWLEVFFDPSMPGGLYHACNSGKCSWREYGMKALEYGVAAGLIFQTTRVEPIRLADMKQFIAPRPVYSILSTTKLSEATGHTPRHWQEALRDYILKKYAPISSPS